MAYSPLWSSGGGGGDAEWGGITGTISAQTDLSSAINTKANLSHAHIAVDITDFSEAVDDRVAALLLATGGSFSYNDAGNTLTLNITPSTSYFPQGF